MLDDHNDKDMQRNQIIAMVVMLVFIGVWTYFFLPRGQQPQPAAPAPVEQQQAQQSPDSPAAAQTPATAATPDSPSGSTELPPVATEFQEGDDVILRNEALELTFTRVGARLKQARVLLGKEEVDSVELVPQQSYERLEDLDLPLGLRFASNYLGESLNYRRWDASVSPAGDAITFSINVPGQASIEKVFRVDGATHVLTSEVRYTNTGAEPRVLGLDTKEPAVSLVWQPQVLKAAGDAGNMMPQKIIWHVQGINERTATSDLEGPAAGSWFTERHSNAEWAAIRSAHFVVALKPEFPGSDLWVSGVTDNFALGASVPRAEVAPGQSLTGAFTLYLGPNQKSYLAEAWPSLSSAQEFFEMFSIMDSFAKLLLSILNWMYNHIWPNYGVAIILLTLLVRVVVFPLTWKSMLSMKKMQKLAPEMEKLKNEYKDDPEEFQRKMMDFYRERGVNPLGGCLPLFLQMPVFIALYRMLATSFELRHAPFVGWITDLSAPDRLIALPFDIPLIFMSIDAINLLPILMALSMVASMWTTPQPAASVNPQQQVMMRIMPVFFALICYNVASGLSLYILTSTLLGIAQNLVIQRMDIEVDVEKKKSIGARAAAAKPKHFYNVAQQKKREMAKEARREKRGAQAGAKTNTPRANKDRRP